MDASEFHKMMTSNDCACGHDRDQHQYGDYYDADDIKRTHQGECSQCGCQGYC